MIIGLALTGVLLILGIVMFSFIVTSFQNGFGNHSGYNDRYHSINDSSLYN